jgi:hypothetical protein
MTAHTKRNTIIALIFLSVSVSLLSFLVWQIQQAGKKLDTYLSVLQEQSTQEAAYLQVSRLVQETESQRNALSQSFFTDESESIAFLNDIESLAARSGVTLKTEGLDKLKDKDGDEFITMTFIFGGSYEKVRRFTELFESIPYHSRITSVSLRKTATTAWEGQLSILISLM